MKVHAFTRGLPLPDRIRAFVDQSEDEAACWLWLGAKARGYGVMSVKEDGASRLKQAHRLSFETFVGPIPSGLVLDHLCANKACVNPRHLEPVTQVENLRRWALRT